MVGVGGLIQRLYHRCGVEVYEGYILLNKIRKKTTSLNAKYIWVLFHLNGLL